MCGDQATSALSDLSNHSLEEVQTPVKEVREVVSSKVVQITSDTKEGSEAMGNYARRIWRVSNYWRTPPACNSGNESAGSPQSRILIVFSDTGGGHKASANSLKAALEHSFPGEVDVRVRDVMEDYTLWPSNRIYNYWSSIPWLWGAIYNSTKKTHSLTGDAFLLDPARVMEPSVLEGFIRCVQEEQPDVIISVHPILQSAPRACTSHYKHGKRIPFATVVTDLGEAHPWWFNASVDRLFVPIESMREQALQFGFSAAQVEVVGLPLRQGFWKVDPSSANRERIRDKLGLAADHPVVLIMGGGDGMGKLAECARSFIDMEDPGAPNAPQIVIICGKNEVVRTSLQAAATKRAAQFAIAPRVLGFVSNMDEWMLAAAVLVTKAGPGTIAEACCSGLPILLFDFLPGQEEGNVKFVVEGEMGVFVDRARDAATVCKSWLADPAKLAGFREKSLAAARPQSSLQIATKLGALIEQARSARLEEARGQGAGEWGVGDKGAEVGGKEDAAGGKGGGKFELRSSWWTWLSLANKDRAPSWWREVPID